MLVSGSRVAATVAVLAALLGSAAVAHAADAPPRLDVTTSCEAAARSALSLGRERESCLADERAAKDDLEHNWSKYGAADKVRCVGNVGSGGPASYVELLSCLDVMKDAKDSGGIEIGDTEQVPPQPWKRPKDQVARPDGKTR